MRFRYTLSSTYSGSLILTKDPKGWESMETIIKRGTQYHGTFYETMVQLQFTCGAGKEYIDDIYETYGVDALVNILIEINCGGGIGNVDAPDYSIDYSDDYGSIITGSGAAVYETFFEGTLDFSKYNKTTRSTFVDLLQSDFIQKTINRFETKVNIDELSTLDEGVSVTALSNVPYELTLPSKAVLFKTQYEYYPDVDDIHTPFANDGIVIEIPVLNTLDEIDGAVTNSSPYMFSFLSSGAANGIEHTEPVFTNSSSSSITLDIDVELNGSITLRNTFGPHVNHNILIQVGGTQFSLASYPTNPFPIFILNNIVVNGGIQFTTIFASSHSDTITVPSGESVFVVHYFADVVGNNASPGTFEFLSATYSTFKIEFSNESIVPETETDGYYVHEVGAMIAQRITGVQDSFRSNLLGRTNSEPVTYDDNGCLSFMSMSNGKKIRQMPFNKSNLFMSMAEYYNTINAIGNIGLGFEKIEDQYVIRIEEKEYFYTLTVLMQCPFANEIKTSVAKEYYVSDIEIGYDKWESEETNGIDEFNSKHNYNTGIKSIELRQSFLSPSLASSYAIEFTRRKKYNKFPSLDWKYDNDNFIICLNRTVDEDNVPNNLNQVELDENYSDINEIYSPESTYNYRISPKRNLLRHLSAINGSLTKYANRLIKFVYGEGNYLMETQFTADTCHGNFDNELLTENQDIDWTASGVNPIWIPEYIEFEYPMGFSTFLAIKNNPYGCIEVSNTDSNFVKGYIIELRYKPVGGMSSFKLLRAFEA